MSLVSKIKHHTIDRAEDGLKKVKKTAKELVDNPLVKTAVSVFVPGGALAMAAYSLYQNKDAVFGAAKDIAKGKVEDAAESAAKLGASYALSEATGLDMETATNALNATEAALNGDSQDAIKELGASYLGEDTTNAISSGIELVKGDKSALTKALSNALLGENNTNTIYKVKSLSDALSGADSSTVTNLIANIAANKLDMNCSIFK